MRSVRAMTELEWLGCTDPDRMLDYLGGEEHRTRQALLRSGEAVTQVLLGCPPLKVIRRKFQLFAAACCRQVEHLLPEERLRDAIGFAERRADGEVRREEGDSLMRELLALHDRYEGVRGAVTVAVYGAADMGSPLYHDSPAHETKRVARAVRVVDNGQQDIQVTLLRDVVGNPFRPVTLDSRWLQPVVLALAEGIYAERRFADMPVLADALEDAGCADRDVLAHLRLPGPHVLGCWALDLLLGKS